MCKSRGILLDPIYTGKVMAGMIDLAQKKIIDPDITTIFLHTGGLPIIFSFESELGKTANCTKFIYKMRHALKHIVLFLTIILLPISISLPQNKNTTDEKFIKDIIDKFSNDDPYVNDEAITEVVKYGDYAVEYLIESLQSENENVRWCSAIALGKIAPEGGKAIPYLTMTLNDSNSNVRWCSAIALGKFNQAAETAIPELQKLLFDGDDNVQWAAYVSLSKISKESINIAPEFSEVIKKIENLTPQLMKELNVPGLSIALIRNNEIAFTKSFGVKDVQPSLQ